MCRRFFVDRPVVGECARLEGSEAEHLIRVLRAKVDDEVVLFDGSGAEFPARVVTIGRSHAELRVLERSWVDRELSPPLVLAVALPKGDRQRWLVEKAVELGVAQLVPLVTKRGVAQPVDRALDRLRRAVVEASKQCGRNRLMEISSPQTLAECFAAAPLGCQRWLAHPCASAQPLRELLQQVTHDPLLAAVGPEGGFTDDEIAAAGPECQLVTLGPRILRIETVALAVASGVALLRQAVA
ncbi:MAG: 16S rRNA (uracil(1498)-N(3))-methyltransferase [Pirellulaceae bacterium]|nr:16S rRNA (uracil(1498)-N(3))-methyltransferase [Pirellulaceae bacterium]